MPEPQMMFQLLANKKELMEFKRAAWQKEKKSEEEKLL
jgi:hypothetical protein